MDYEKLNFKAGLEVHQQIEGKKLFCSCPTILRDNPHDILIKRRLRAVAGEAGNVDIAAIHEMLKNKEFIYEGYKDSTCLVEYDCEPPHYVNLDALEITLQVCKLLNCKIVDEIQIMRKIVVDGSNTSGFQRTMFVGYDGYLDSSKGKISILSVCLEEDAARKLKEDEKSITYRLDRLGIPLIEIVTGPEIKNPDHAKEVAEKIGMILRSTGKAKRGIGSIRQDINISIKNGERVEIKGFQDLRIMPKTIEYEAERQLREKVKKEVRRAEPDGTTSFLRPMPGADRMYPETDIMPILVSKKILDSIKLPELIDEIVLRYEKEGLSSELARSLVKSGFKLEDYDYDLDKKTIADVLVEIPKEIKSRFNLDYDFEEKDFRFVLEALSLKKIEKSAAIEVMINIVNGEKINLDKYKPIDLAELENVIKKLVKDKKELSIGALMGIIMEKYKGKVDGKTAARIIAEYKK